MKLHKYEVYVLDFEDFGPEEYKNLMEHNIDFITVFVQGSSKEIVWDDDHELNQRATSTIETYRKYIIDV
jgi:hypothetical protein